MILTHPGLTKLTFMDYLLTMLRNLLRRKLSYDNAVWWWSDGGCGAAGRGGGAAAAQVWRRAKRLEDGPIDLPLTGSFLCGISAEISQRDFCTLKSALMGG